MTRRFIGVDPGLSGGVAVLELAGTGRTVRLFRTPVVVVRKRGVKRREYDVPAMLLELADACDGYGMRESSGIPAVIALELVSARPAPGARGQGGGRVAAFRLGVGFGLWHGLAIGLQRPVCFVPPAVWKRYAGLIGCDKAASRLKAAELYPEVGPLKAADEGPAEALLLAHWLAAHELTPKDEAAAARIGAPRALGTDLSHGEGEA